MPARILSLVILRLAPSGGHARSQPPGWPLTEAETNYVPRPEDERRPGVAEKKHLSALRPVAPTVGHWGGSKWLETHTKLVDHVQANRGPVDILPIGDSITQQWGSLRDGMARNAAWKKHIDRYKTDNLGVAGDKTQVDGTLKPELFQADNIHLTHDVGYEFFAACLQPLLARCL